MSTKRKIHELLDAANIPRNYEDGERGYKPTLNLLERVQILISQRDYCGHYAFINPYDVFENRADEWIAEHKQPKKPEPPRIPQICGDCGDDCALPMDQPGSCQCIPF